VEEVADGSGGRAKPDDFTRWKGAFDVLQERWSRGGRGKAAYRACEGCHLARGARRSGSIVADRPTADNKQAPADRTSGYPPSRLHSQRPAGCGPTADLRTNCKKWHFRFARIMDR